MLYCIMLHGTMSYYPVFDHTYTYTYSPIYLTLKSTRKVNEKHCDPSILAKRTVTTRPCPTLSPANTMKTLFC